MSLCVVGQQVKPILLGFTCVACSVSELHTHVSCVFV